MVLSEILYWFILTMHTITLQPKTLSNIEPLIRKISLTGIHVDDLFFKLKWNS